MAKRKTKRRTTRRASPKKVSRRRKSSGGGSAWQPIAYGGYGFARGKINTFVREKAGNMVGGLSDEIVMLGLAWGAKKFVKNSTVRKIASAGMNIEAFRLGEMAANGGLGNALGGGSNGAGGVQMAI